jgi:hypothetical protein
LSIIEGILEKVYLKLYSTENEIVQSAVGIYKLNKVDSAKLIPLLNNYRETTRGKSLPDDSMKQQLKSQPFIWFQLGSDIVKPSSIVSGIRALFSTPAAPAAPVPPAFLRAAAAAPPPPSLSDQEVISLATTFDNFISIDKAESVFMMVRNMFPDPNDTSSYSTLLHIYDAAKEPDNITTWNEKLTLVKPFGITTTGTFGVALASAMITGGPRLSEIGITQWPLYTIQTHLSFPMLQCMTFLAATNQTSEKTNRYENLVFPIP